MGKLSVSGISCEEIHGTIQQHDRVIEIWANLRNVLFHSQLFRIHDSDTTVSGKEEHLPLPVPFLLFHMFFLFHICRSFLKVSAEKHRVPDLHHSCISYVHRTYERDESAADTSADAHVEGASYSMNIYLSSGTTPRQTYESGKAVDAGAAASPDLASCKGNGAGNYSKCRAVSW